MVDPVVSSRFGSRPLLDIPAMQVSSTSHREIPSLQNPVPALRLDTYGAGFPRAGEIIPRSYHTAPPPEPFHYEHYQPREYNHYYGPRGEVVRPSLYHSHPIDKYPGVHIPFTSYHHAPPPLPPPPPPPQPLYHHAPVSVPVHPYPTRVPAHYGRRPQAFDVTCELDYGRVAHISVRESHGHFRGIPEYLRQELMKTYGKYPYMEVKIRFENGDYHIYANHDRRQNRRDHDDRPRNGYYEEENDYEDYKSERRPDDEDSQTDAIRPREMGAPRGILRERGWNSYR